MDRSEKGNKKREGFFSKLMARQNSGSCCNVKIVPKDKEADTSDQTEDSIGKSKDSDNNTEN
ncbi:MAG: hypothetical protein GX338_03885 [Firmicutes bacterium]|nr:hypothetical protein [Bacillota bacterium]